MKIYSKWLLLSAFLAVCVSCRESRHNQMERLVQEWNGKEIRFPSHPVFTRFVTDTVPYRIPKTDYKVVVFVDSVGCISCKLQLPKWKEFMHEVDSLCEGKVSFVFFFQSADVKELRYILRRDGFSLPVCIDADDSFNSLNHFPGEMMFQTFLVDSENRVKVIGNPIHNLSVKDLYLKELTGMKSDPVPVTTVHSDSVEYHYGTVGENQTESKKVILHNTGKEVFRIKGVTTSCDCMTVEYGWDEIQPGESAVLTVKYKAEEPGDFWRTITIYGNIPDQSITLDFWGTVRK
ncbi:DUF1573 domain-containing protein [Phocaeicola coprophilus]|mgnify:FL=1|jgi:hypothetical protein|uniref:DUF1573 domain-containing protein n=1 Tax=Phocaeicola coprophilus TaxID=387090 RepID=UPI001950E5E2|nr:DUF1573 domain-containing protein [Phocaeicola coprophilus]QRO23315.1 DUF1573 domain-containing protein [Phocaeicola coprophilus]